MQSSTIVSGGKGVSRDQSQVLHLRQRCALLTMEFTALSLCALIPTCSVELAHVRELQVRAATLKQYQPTVTHYNVPHKRRTKPF